MWWYEGDWGWAGWLIMMLGMLAFWALAIWAILGLVRTSTGGVPRGEATPEQILAGRFARGEIDEDDYRRRLDALRGSQPARGAGPGGRS